MFKGVSDITIDNKGRATMPQRYRKDFYEKRKSSLIITADKDQCLLIYPLTIWNDVERQLLQLPSYSNEARFLQRLVLGFATETELDNQGRFLIPNPLRKQSGVFCNNIERIKIAVTKYSSNFTTCTNGVIDISFEMDDFSNICTIELSSASIVKTPAIINIMFIIMNSCYE